MSDFNPYREWLGIKTTGSVSYYQLLGVRREDSNDRIREQATRLVRMLKQIDAGEHEAPKRQLIDRVRRAAKRLLDPALREAYDRELDKQARQQQPRAAPNRKTKHRERSGEVVEATKSLGESSIVEPVDVEAEPAEESGDSQRELAEQQSAEKQKPDLDFDVAKKDTGVRHNTGKTVTDELLRMRPRKRNIAPAYKAARRRSRSMTISLLLAGFCILGISYLMTTQTAVGKQWLATVWPTTSRNGDSVVSVDSTPKDNNQVPALHSDQIAPVAIATTSSNSQRVRTGPQRAEPISLPEAVDSPTAPELLEALKKAKRLLGERKADEATQVLNDAGEFATDTFWRARLARMTTLASYVASYWNAAQKQVASFRAGNEATIGDTPVMIVEKTDWRLVIRNAGRNQTVDLTNLSQSLAEKLADDWLNEDAPSTKVFRGAMMAVTPGHNAAECLALWREAEASGELKLHDLAQVLDELTEY